MIGGCFGNESGVLCLLAKVYYFIPGGAYGSDQAVVRVAISSGFVNFINFVHYFMF